MSEPFFDYITDNNFSISNDLFGYENKEKRYERLDYLTLPAVVQNETSLIEALNKRKSPKTFSNRKMTLQDLSNLLYSSVGKDQNSLGKKNYNFPSGGGFYPIETYIEVVSIEGLPTGLYHYASVDHSVALIGKNVISGAEDIKANYFVELENDPSAVIYMTSVKSRYIKKYGSVGYKLCFLEAGHRGQNIALLAAANNLGVRSMGGGNNEFINKILGVDGVNEHYIYKMVVGPVD